MLVNGMVVNHFLKRKKKIVKENENQTMTRGVSDVHTTIDFFLNKLSSIDQIMFSSLSLIKFYLLLNLFWVEY